VAGKLHPGEGEVEALDQHRCLLRIQGDSLEWLSFMLIWHGVDFVVEEPPELLAYLEQLAERLKGAALRSTSEATG
jgi:hypothetical protein